MPDCIEGGEKREKMVQDKGILFSSPSNSLPARIEEFSPDAIAPDPDLTE